VYKRLEDPTFLLATDAGWANDFDEEMGEKINSRAGWVVVAVDKAVRDGAESHANFLGWKSHRLDRVCNSTLMAESCSLADGLAELRVFQLLWAEATTGNKLENLIGQPMPAIVTVDCKSVWDTCNSYGSNKNKRTLIELVVIKRDIRQHGHMLMWVDTRYMLADPLTKLGHDGSFLRSIMTGSKYAVEIERSAHEQKKREREHKKCLQAAKTSGKTEQVGEAMYVAVRVRCSKALLREKGTLQAWGAAHQ